MSDKTLLHIVHLESRMLLTRRQYDDWRQIQSEFPDYKASLGPWPADEVADFFRLDWGEDDTHWPFSREQIAAYLESDQETIARNVTSSGTGASTPSS